MARKRPRSAGVRHPGRNALLFAVATLPAQAGVVVDRFRAQLGTD